MEYNIISADGHIDLDYLPGDLFISNTRPEWKDKMPRRIELDDGFEWWAENLQLSLFSKKQRQSTPETSERTTKMAMTSFFDDADAGRPHPSTLDLRLKDLELDGVDAEIIYGLTFTGTTMLGTRERPGFPKGNTPPEVVDDMFRIYNDWVADFVGKVPERLGAMACVTNHDPAAAADELRRTAKMGLKGIVMECYGASPPIFYDDWDVLWRASAECGVPIHFHIAGLNFRRPNPEDMGKYGFYNGAAGMVMGQLEGNEIIAAMVLSGACERFPDMKFVLGETGVAWMPFLLDRMDHECTGLQGLKMKPSDYWRRQGNATYQAEGFVGDVVHLIGENTIMWGSDYPHHDGVWPDSQNAIERDLRKVTPEVRRMITRDNAAELYGFK